jgi:hypothetical protein
MKLLYHFRSNDTVMSLYFALYHYIVEVLNNFWAIIKLTVNQCVLYKRKLLALCCGLTLDIHVEVCTSFLFHVDACCHA